MEKIDGIVATIMALDRCIRKKGDDHNVYDERGILSFQFATLIEVGYLLCLTFENQAPIAFIYAMLLVYSIWRCRYDRF